MFEPIVTGVPAATRSAEARGLDLAGEERAGPAAPPAFSVPRSNTGNFDSPAAVSLLAVVPQTLGPGDRAEIEAPVASAGLEREAWWTVFLARFRPVPGRPC